VDPHASNLVGEERFRYPLKVVRFIRILLAVLLVWVPALRAQETPTWARPLLTQAAESRLVNLVRSSWLPATSAFTVSPSEIPTTKAETTVSWLRIFEHKLMRNRLCP
jgi:hypothetical protein